MRAAALGKHNGCVAAPARPLANSISAHLQEDGQSVGQRISVANLDQIATYLPPVWPIARKLCPLGAPHTC